MSRVSVMLACSGLGHVVRGYERVTADLGRALAVAVDVTVLRGGGPWLDRQGLRIPCLQRRGRLARALVGSEEAAYALEQRSFAAGVFAWARLRRPDVVHVHDPALMNALWHARRRLGASFSIVFTNGGWLDPRHLVRPDVVHCVTPVDAERLRQAGFPREKVVHVPYGIDLPATSSQPWRGGTLNVVSVGALTAQKGMHVAIRAVSRVPHAHLTMVGQECDDTTTLRALAEELLPGRHAFRTVSPDEIDAVLRGAHVFLLASSSEGFGMAVLEAMARGLPCLVSDVPVLRWLVGHGGHAVTRDDVDSWALHLNALTPDRCAELSAAARARAEEFAWSALVPKYVELYEHASRRMDQGVPEQVRTQRVA
ncbi:MAG: glycosyltransferase family 4 protein [Myxococcota bacterium]